MTHVPSGVPGRNRRLALILAILSAALLVAPAAAKSHQQSTVRFATFNASLNRGAAGQAKADLSTPNDQQAQNVAEIIQRTQPDVLLINEFDYYPNNELATLFQQNYLSIPQAVGLSAISYPYVFIAPSNTGIASNKDLNNNGVIDTTPGDGAYGDDSFGFGLFPGQFGMAVFSRFPIQYGQVRTFQNFLWRDMPGAKLPDNPATPLVKADWYSPDELDIFRLSSKSHWDVPILIGGTTVHFLASHPTPPVFDGPEDRNGTRNFDEIGFWADYIRGGKKARYIYDDAGGRGGLESKTFVIAGDQNSDPRDGDSIKGAIQQLLNHRVNKKHTPQSLGGPQQAALQGGVNTTHKSKPRFDTADFGSGALGNDSAPGNLRADYVLPSKNIKIVDSAVFWPLNTDPTFPLVGPGTFPAPSSDHRLVWVDVRLPTAKP